MKLWQRLMDNWSKLVFRERYPEITSYIRSVRALEEMLELCQVEGVSREDINGIVNQVYAKPVGEAHQEVGGIMTCMLAYCETKGLDLEECLTVEFMRMSDPVIIQKVRKRNLAGDKIGMRSSSRIEVRQGPITPETIPNDERLVLYGKLTQIENYLTLELKDGFEVHIYPKYPFSTMSLDVNPSIWLNDYVGVSVKSAHVDGAVVFFYQNHHLDAEDEIIDEDDSEDVGSPIDEFTDEQDGATYDVLVDDVWVTGIFSCGKTWGWIDEQGSVIYPTRFRKKSQGTSEPQKISVDETPTVTITSFDDLFLSEYDGKQVEIRGLFSAMGNTSAIITVEDGTTVSVNDCPGDISKYLGEEVCITAMLSSSNGVAMYLSIEAV